MSNHQNKYELFLNFFQYKKYVLGFRHTPLHNFFDSIQNIAIIEFFFRGMSIKIKNAHYNK